MAILNKVYIKSYFLLNSRPLLLILELIRST